MLSASPTQQHSSAKYLCSNTSKPTMLLRYYSAECNYPLDIPLSCVAGRRVHGALVKKWVEVEKLKIIGMRSNDNNSL